MFESSSKCRIWIFSLLAFAINFCLIKVICLVTLFDHKIQVFKNSPKSTIFGILKLTFVYSKCKRTSLRSQLNETFSVIFKHCDLPQSSTSSVRFKIYQSDGFFSVISFAFGSPLVIFLTWIFTHKSVAFVFWWFPDFQINTDVAKK